MPKQQFFLSIFLTAADNIKGSLFKTRALIDALWFAQERLRRGKLEFWPPERVQTHPGDCGLVTHNLDDQVHTHAHLMLQAFLIFHF